MERSDKDPRGAIGATLVVVALVAAAAWIGRRLWFFSDDWNILAEYHSGNLLEPFNGHLSLLPAGIYQVLFNTVGVGSYLPYRLVGLAALFVLGFQVARFAGARVGALGTVLAVAAVMWNSFGVTNVMFPFLMNFSLPIAALIAIWWHLDAIDAISAGGSQSGGRELLRHRVAIGLWLALALAASGLGVVAAFAVAVELLLRRAPLRLWAAWAAPTGVWLAWWLFNRGSSEISTDPTQVLPYFLRMLWAGPTSVAAGAAWAGLVIGLGLLGVVVALSWRDRSLDPRVAGALGAAVAFAGLTALTRQDTFPPIPPDELRYGWTIGAYLVLAAVALAPALRKVRLPERASWVRRAGFAAAGLLALVLVIGAVQLTDDMGEWTDQVAGAAPGLRTNLYAAEAVGPERMDPEAVIGPLSFVPVLAVDYLAAVEAVGSPLEGATPEQIGGRQDQRDAASELFFANIGPLEPGPGVASLPEDLEGCDSSIDAEPGESVHVVGIPPGQTSAGPLVLEVSRFGGAPVAYDITGGVSVLTLPDDAGIGTEVAEPYRLEVSDTGRLCRS